MLIIINIAEIICNKLRLSRVVPQSHKLQPMSEKQSMESPLIRGSIEKQTFQASKRSMKRNLFFKRVPMYKEYRCTRWL
jgi:hypothetical protein